MNSSREPKKSDAVLGGTNPLPSQGVVLGGFVGLKQRLSHVQDKEQLQEVLRSALSYGKQGQSIILSFLRNEDQEIRWFAHDLLCGITDRQVREALQLFSKSGIYYAPLQELLGAKQWGAANEWTRRVMLQLGHCYLQVNSANIPNIPCEDLLTINRLWLRHSKGKFGFSVQSEIWHQCQQLRWDENQALGIFGDRVGWRESNFFLETYQWKSYEELRFSDRSPKGHLPWINSIFIIKALHERICTCQDQANSVPTIDHV